MQTVHFGFTHRGEMNTTCRFWLNESHWIHINDTIRLEFRGEAFLHRRLKMALLWGLPTAVSSHELPLVHQNHFPSKSVQFGCHDQVNPHWPCHRKIAKCQKIVTALAETVIINNITLSQFRFETVRITDIQFICSASRQFRFHYDDQVMTCYGPEGKYALGRILSDTFFRCVRSSLDRLSIYEQETEQCATQFHDDRVGRYGVDRGVRFGAEYLKKRSNVTVFPYHYFLRCALKLPRATVSLDNKGVVECRRLTVRIVTSYQKWPTCHDFVAACMAIFDCFARQSPCLSDRFGRETRDGFLLDSSGKDARISTQHSCRHWGVALTTTRDGNVYCKAIRLFSLKSFGQFCPSYDWICQKVLRCHQTRNQCRYVAVNDTQNMMWEMPSFGIFNFPMTDLPPSENPRNLVPKLFQCNKKYGYASKVFLYFLTGKCTSMEGNCSTNVFGIANPKKFNEGITDLVRMNYNPSVTTSIAIQHLIHVWSCKRDALSTIGCQEFWRICHQIKRCLLYSGTTDDVSLDLPEDDTCLSPLPTSTLNPLADGEVGGQGYHTGLLGDSISYTLPLERAYPRRFDTMNYSGWEIETRETLKRKRASLFFSLFLEDCRYKHQFEGFLLEPYFTETVEYLICSIPFGILRGAENGLVSRGCQHVRQACEAMRKCYVRYAEHFGFYAFFNDHGFALAILSTMIFVLSTISAVWTRWLQKTRVFGLELFIEYVVYICLGLTSISLLFFTVQTVDLMEEAGAAVSAKNRVLVPIMHLCWHLSTYFLTVTFHLYIVCFTVRCVPHILFKFFTKFFCW